MKHSTHIQHETAHHLRSFDQSRQEPTISRSISHTYHPVKTNYPSLSSALYQPYSSTNADHLASHPTIGTNTSGNVKPTTTSTTLTIQHRSLSQTSRRSIDQHNVIATTSIHQQPAPQGQQRQHHHHHHYPGSISSSQRLPSSPSNHPVDMRTGPNSNAARSTTVSSIGTISTMNTTQSHNGSLYKSQYQYRQQQKHGNKQQQQQQQQQVRHHVSSAGQHKHQGDAASLGLTLGLGLGDIGGLGRDDDHLPSLQRLYGLGSQGHQDTTITSTPTTLGETLQPQRMSTHHDDDHPHHHDHEVHDMLPSTPLQPQPLGAQVFASHHFSHGHGPSHEIHPHTDQATAAKTNAAAPTPPSQAIAATTPTPTPTPTPAASISKTPRDDISTKSQIHPVSVALSATPSTTTISTELMADILEVIEGKISPAIRADGGDIHMVAYHPQSRTLDIALSGACASCDRSTVTMKILVENALKYYFPDDIVKVQRVALTDAIRDALGLEEDAAQDDSIWEYGGDQSLKYVKY